MAEVNQMGALPVQHPAGIMNQNWVMSLSTSIISWMMCDSTLFKNYSQKDEQGAPEVLQGFNYPNG